MKIKVPFLTSNEDEVLVVDVLVSNKQYIKKNQKLFILETTKTSFEVDSQNDGFLYFNFNLKDYLKCGELMYEVFETMKQLEENIISEKKVSSNRVITDDAKKIIEEEKIDIGLIKDKIITKETLEKFLKKNEKIPIPKGGTKSVIIVGASNHGKTAYDFLKDGNEFEPIGFINYDKFKVYKEKIYNLNVFGLDDLRKIFENGTKNIYINTNKYSLTQKIYFEAKKIGYSFINVIHKSANISNTAKIGECVFVGPFSIIGTNAKIGSFTKLLNKASVAHDTIVGNDVQISDGATIAGNVIVGNSTIIGINSAIINKCKIGNGVTIISGKTVTSDLDDNVVFK